MGLFQRTTYDLRTPTCIRTGRIGRVTGVRNDGVFVYIEDCCGFESIRFDNGTEALMVATRIADQIAEGKRHFVVDLRTDEEDEE